MENINSYIDYTNIFNDVVKTHLEMYPTANDYIDDFLNVNEKLPEKYRKEAKELYRIICNLDNFSKQHEGICLENSSLDTDNNKCTVVFYVDNSTSTENGFDADFYLWIFKIDLTDGVIIKYTNDY